MEPCHAPARLRTSFAAALLVIALAPANGGAGTEGPDFDESRVQWNAAELRASKFFLSLEVDMTLRKISASAAAAQLEDTDDWQGLPPPDPVLDMSYVSDGLVR